MSQQGFLSTHHSPGLQYTDTHRAKSQQKALKPGLVYNALIVFEMLLLLLLLLNLNTRAFTVPVVFILWGRFYQEVFAAD